MRMDVSLKIRIVIVGESWWFPILEWFGLTAGWYTYQFIRNRC